MISAAKNKPSALSRVYNPFDNLFRNNFWDTLSPELTATNPSVNIKESKSEYLIEMAAPGMKRDDFNIDIENNLVTIWCERETEDKDEDENFSRREYNYSSFSRSFTLPQNAKTEKVTARYKDGMLTLNIPKNSEAPKTSGKKIIVE